MRCHPTRKPASALRAARGFTLLLALGLIALVTAGVLVSLRAVNAESTLQAHERRSREALFAAEAGLAEGRAVVLAMLNAPVSGSTGNYNQDVLPRLQVVAEAGLPDVASGGVPWRELIPQTPYTLARGTALDETVTAPSTEINDVEGTPIRAYPEARGVSYRVFVVEDDDDADRDADANGRIWLVSVGEVQPAGTGLPYRTIIRSLLEHTSTQGGLACSYGTKMGCRGTGTSGSGLPTF
ncbi:hypothetical protein [Corallococcus macrosporus]|uniref:Type 4 fimbrial biogenesis protein PilX N-terminal domain-containing protein n=1 Tax=Myxococcus fulvus (strain ATCC BAA-855 / HW-1) TaxID=483219 RepID=F8CJC7_MYXFH|nr:hypothetical protein [Corallococcus macrosporus]AEI62640.1 hypothetical protein LILAB_03575 [Corallococcus macrosporus]